MRSQKITDGDLPQKWRDIFYSSVEAKEDIPATEDQSNAPVEIQFFLNMADNFKLLLLPELDMLFADDEDELCGTEDEMITFIGPLLVKTL